MPKVAVVESGGETARHAYADVAAFVEECCLSSTQGRALLTLRGEPLSVESFVDDEASFLFSGVTPETYAAIVFASNALRSTAVAESVEHHSEALGKYLRGAGGVIVLHQWGVPLPSFLTKSLKVSLADRPGREETSLLAVERPDDVLLQFPDRHDAIFDEAQSRGVPGRVYWRTVERHGTSSELSVVVTSKTSSAPVLVRSSDVSNQRVVLSMIAADWERDAALMRNAISFATAGSPRALVWRDTSSEDALLAGQIALRSGGVSREESSDIFTTRPPTAEEQWLMSVVDVCVLPTAEALRQVLESPDGQGSPALEHWAAALREMVDRGGTAVAANATPRRGVAELHAFVGSHLGQPLARRLAQETATNPSWGDAPSAGIFLIRDVLSARTYFQRVYGDDAAPALDRAKVSRLVQRVSGVGLGANADIGTVCAAGECLHYLECLDPKVLDEDARRELHTARANLLSCAEQQRGRVGADVRLQIRAVFETTSPEKGRDWLAAAHDQAGELSGAQIGRLLDSVGFLSVVGFLEEVEPQRVRELATRCVDQLESRGQNRGWGSIEATTNIARGLAALSRSGRGDSPAVASALARVAIALRDADDRFHEKPQQRGIGGAARLAEALAAVDRAYPAGLDRMLPTRPADPSAQSVDIERLQRDLAESNARLGESEAKCGMLNAEVSELREDARAAAVGRAVAAIGFVLLLIAFGFAIYFVGIRLANTAADGAQIVALIFVIFGALIATARAVLLRFSLAPPWLARILETISSRAPQA